ncbi:helix-turn-helix transcriptional regulator [Lactococcus sp. dk322]|nr:helix-turn-helix transcriptional regulator [Lactococcus sp. dk322]
MEPDFHNGEVALIKKQNQADYEGQVCAVDWDGNSYIKKVYMEEEGLVLRSINSIYDDKFASWDEQPRIIGIVTGHFRPEQKNKKKGMKVPFLYFILYILSFVLLREKKVSVCKG